MKQSFLPTSMGPLGQSIGAHLFERILPKERFFQIRNFARTYRPGFTRDFSLPSTRSEEVFRFFYNQAKMEPKIVSLLPAAYLRGGASITFCDNNHQLTSIFRSMSSGGRHTFQSIATNNFTISPYERLHLTLSGSVFNNLTPQYFDGFKNHLLKFSIKKAKFKYTSTSPL